MSLSNKIETRKASPHRKEKNGSVSKPTKKLRAYQNLFAMNRGFEIVLLSCTELKKLGFLPRRNWKRFQAMAEELRAGINHTVTETVRDSEEQDWARFGRISSQDIDQP